MAAASDAVALRLNASGLGAYDPDALFYTLAADVLDLTGESVRG